MRFNIIHMAKRQCLGELAGTKGVTDSALRALLKKLSAVGDVNSIPHSRRSIGRALDKMITTPTLYGPVMATVSLPLRTNGRTFSWEVPNPAALLNFMCMFSPRFATLMDMKLQQNPCRPSEPWKIAFYADEAMPGNLLSLNHNRKSWCFYWQVAWVIVVV